MSTTDKFQSHSAGTGAAITHVFKVVQTKQPPIEEFVVGSTESKNDPENVPQ